MTGRSAGGLPGRAAQRVDRRVFPDGERRGLAGRTIGRMAARDRARALAAAALVVAGCLWLCGCERLLLAVPVEVGMAVAEERTVVDAVDDLTIRLALNDAFIRENARLYRAVSFSVVEGRVLLKGSVPTPQDRVRALGLAKGVAGVREVIDGLQVGEDRGTLAYMREAWISAQLRTKLVLDLAVLHINYDVETVNGVVYLIGIAQDEEELERVVAHARDIPGVRRVANYVTVKDHPRRLPRLRDRRGRRTQARRGNAASGATPGSDAGYGQRYDGDASRQARPEGGRMTSWPRWPAPGSMHRPPRARTPRPPGLQARNPARLRCRPLSVFSAAGVSLELPQSPR